MTHHGPRRAGSTYPTQIVEAARFLKQNYSLTGEALVNAVNQAVVTERKGADPVPLGAAEHER
jgi:hypothetical protein